MSARPFVIVLPPDYELGELTRFLAADARRQNYRLAGQIAREQDVLILRPVRATPAPPVRAAEDLQ